MQGGKAAEYRNPRDSKNPSCSEYHDQDQKDVAECSEEKSGHKQDENANAMLRRFARFFARQSRYRLNVTSYRPDKTEEFIENSPRAGLQ